MNAEDRKIQEDLSKTLKEIHTVLVGNEEYKIKGLLERQEDDEDFKREMIEEFKEFKSNQQKTWNKIETNHKEIGERLEKHFGKIKEQEERISVLEKFQSLINRLSNLKKRTVAFIGTVFTILISIISYWEKVKQFVINLYHHFTS
jgi:predicted PurR-regulated permease PerM